jgi:Family of unknown function (DUF6174)
MRKHLGSLLVGATVLVTGCSSATGLDAHGADETSGPAHPTATPWPAYDVDDYTYTLRTMCFCPDGGVPIVVTVRDGQAVDAVYARRGRGHAAGDPASEWMRVSINDVINAANTKGAARVRVAWPIGQDYPTSVYIDRDTNAVDDEIAYAIRHVSPT